MGDPTAKQRAQDSLEFYCNLYWAALFVNTVLLVCYLFWALTASNFQHTYFAPPAQPGTLSSQRWSADFFATGSLAALFVLIISGAWVVSKPLRGQGLFIHFVLLIIAFLYYLVVLCFIWSFQLARANVPSADNAGNSANDARWCCVNYNLGGCPNSPNNNVLPHIPGFPCTPGGIGQADLIPDGVFVMKFCCLIIALVLMLIDAMYMVFVIRGAIRDCIEAIDQDEQTKGEPTDLPAAAARPPHPSAPVLEPGEKTGTGIAAGMNSRITRAMLKAPMQQQQQQHVKHTAPSILPRVNTRK
jgi:hypothetical protein